MNIAVLGLILIILGAFVTFAGSNILDRFVKEELSPRQVVALKLIGFIIVLGGAILVFQFGGRI